MSTSRTTLRLHKRLIWNSYTVALGNQRKRLICESSPVFSNKMHLNNIHYSVVRQDDFAQQARIEAEQKEQTTRDDDHEEKIKAEILDSALEEVAEHDWSRAAVAAAAVKLGHPSVVSGLVTRGGVDLVLHHINTSNKSLDTWMEEEIVKLTDNGAKKLPIGKFVKSAVVKRLMMNAKFLKSNQWAKAMALVASPQVASESLGAMQSLCDDIWYRAGDTSTDINWYSKRISLAAVYTSTEVFMVQDKSEGFKDTLRFLDRRLEDLQALPSIKQMPGDIVGFVSGVVTTVKNIAGVQK